MRQENGAGNCLMVTSGDQLLWQLRIMRSLQDGAAEVGKACLSSQN